MPSTDLSKRAVYLQALETLYGRFRFKRAFWALAILVVLNQVLTVTIYLCFFESGDDYYLYAEVGGILWSLALAALVFYEFMHASANVARILNLTGLHLQRSLPVVFKSFLFAAVTILALTALLPDGYSVGRSYDGLNVVLMIVSTVILAPIIEELAFRGYLYTAMRSTFRRRRERLVVNALLFSGAHVFLPFYFLGADVPYYVFVLGYLLAYLYEEYQSVIPCILLHAMNNAFALAVELCDIHSRIGLND